MTLRTLGAYLFFGSRQAILDIAADPRSLGIGFLLTLSAGFARSYDGASLLYQPWRLLAPAGASVVTSLFLFSLLYVAVKLSHPPPGTPLPFFSLYKSFLGLYWMTAPLAWLYAVPYERFLSSYDATVLNMWTLAIVSLWRVFLMMQVISVITPCSKIGAFVTVMLMGDIVALTAILAVHMPVIDIMGGIGERLTETETLINAAVLWVLSLGFLTFLAWLVGYVIFLVSGKGKRDLGALLERKKVPLGWDLRAFVALSLGAWLVVLPFTQREQTLKSKVEREFRKGRIPQALTIMSAHQIRDFPPLWAPPPKRQGPAENKLLLAVVKVVTRENPAPWVREIYLARFREHLKDSILGAGFSRYPGDEFDEILSVLKSLPEGGALVRENEVEIQATLDLLSRDEHFKKGREYLQGLLKLAESP